MARRLIFVTGGAATVSARRFLDEQPQPVLYKPLDLASLGAAIEQVCRDALAEPPAVQSLR